MIFVKRNANGDVTAVSRGPVEGDGGEDWHPVSGAEPEVLAFSRAIVEAGNPMSPSDLGLVRVLEDLIDLLVDRAVIRFTDLPLPAQSKLLERRGSREAMQRSSLLEDDGVI
ncbi:MAG: hypothetical protein ROZ37_16605 [Aromatoleum sp.]|jgi:hypothetical protein|uniref:hypothetical protein n=1 Tax=Aromatoleum sp. TaxID=2307007 RepID=UPI002895BBC0|nr:hypothetical protein [Aromatoleum sp.]MDT3671941.1 hypothetical protein [Aromatoleum sp.]